MLRRSVEVAWAAIDQWVLSTERPGYPGLSTYYPLVREALFQDSSSLTEGSFIQLVASGDLIVDRGVRAIDRPAGKRLQRCTPGYFWIAPVHFVSRPSPGFSYRGWNSPCGSCPGRNVWTVCTGED